MVVQYASLLSPLPKFDLCGTINDIFEKMWLKMTTNDIIRDIAKRKDEMNITNQMLADASGVPKTTIDRVLRGDTANPSMQTVLDMAYVVGYRLVNDNDAGEREQQVTMLVRESRLKTIQSNALIAEKDNTISDKDRWIKFLIKACITFAVLLLLTWAGFALLLHYDLTHAGTGFFRG